MTDKRVPWPFAESPGEVADKLREAYRYFGNDMLAAVRNVFIEQRVPLATDAPDERMVHASYVHDATREMLAMRAERDALKAALRECFCPRPANNRPDGFTVGECTDAKECGCVCGAPLAAPEDAP